MTVAAAAQADASQAGFTQTIALAGRAVQALEALLAEATDAVRARVSVAGKISSERIEADQHAVHGLAWLATYVTGLREMVRWAERLAEAGRLGETEALLLAVGVGEYLDQVFGGIPMSQNEIVRLTGARSRRAHHRGPPHRRGRGADRRPATRRRIAPVSSS